MTPDVYIDRVMSEMMNSLMWSWMVAADLGYPSVRREFYDARAEIAAVNEAMSSPNWRGPARHNGCHEPCDNWNGPCVCGAWHKDGK